jgi:hypothetical protein
MIFYLQRKKKRAGFYNGVVKRKIYKTSLIIGRYVKQPLKGYTRDQEGNIWLTPSVFGGGFCSL